MRWRKASSLLRTSFTFAIATLLYATPGICGRSTCGSATSLPGGGLTSLGSFCTGSGCGTSFRPRLPTIFWPIRNSFVPVFRSFTDARQPSSILRWTSIDSGLWRTKTTYLTVSRSVPYKRVPLIVEAFRRMPHRRLVVIGNGPETSKVRAAAAGAANIEILGFQSGRVVEDYMRRARAFIFAAREDFGIVPVEAQACGTPVIAYGDGGVVESVRGLGYADRPTGVFFEQQTSDAIIAAVDRFERNSDAFSAEQCRANALRFSPERFRDEFGDFVNRCLHWRDR